MSAANRKLTLRSAIICSFFKCSLTKADNLARHINRKHEGFIKIRAEHENISMHHAMKLTTDEHINGGSVPEDIFQKYMSQYRQHLLKTRPGHRSLATSQTSELVGKAPKTCNSYPDAIFK